MGQKPGSKEEAVLLDLCVRFGYCLPAQAQAAILENAPSTPGSFVDAVIVAEGLAPADVPHRAEMVGSAERIFDSDVWGRSRG